MSKKRIDLSVNGRVTAESPFAALAGIKSALPEGPAADADATEVSSSSPRSFGSKLVVTRERKGRGGKTATVVRGFSTDVDRESLAASMRKALGTSGLVEGDAIVLGGDIAQRVADWLQRNGAARVVIGN